MSITVETAPALQLAARETVGPVMEMADTVIEAQRAEIEGLRERLTYYQAFDALINDNIKRSAELFRTIHEERERARRQVVEARAEIEAAVTAAAERRLREERQRTEATLLALMDEADRFRRQLDGWVQRLADAIAATRSLG